MGKKATKAAGNIYYEARSRAAEEDSMYASREGAAELLSMDRTKLARIELGNVLPYPEEVLAMAKGYNAPELCNAYCATQCPIGKKTVQKVELDDFDRLSLKVLGSLKGIEELKSNLISISEDGKVDAGEREAFEDILNMLDKISVNAEALKLWAEKNIRLD